MLTGGPGLSAGEREGGEGRWPAGPTGPAGRKRAGGIGEKGFFFIFKPNFQIHFQIELLSKLTLCF